MRRPGNGWFRVTPSAGSHTYSIRAFRGTGNGTVGAGAGGAGAYPAGLHADHQRHSASLHEAERPLGQGRATAQVAHDVGSRFPVEQGRQVGLVGDEIETGSASSASTR